MKFLRKLAGLFKADWQVIAAVLLGPAVGWPAARVLPPHLVAGLLLALFAGGFAAGVQRAARARAVQPRI